MRDHGTLILLRHGESTANAAGLFTGVLDVALTVDGVAEGRNAAALLNTARLSPDVVLTSTLRRAQETATIVRSLLPTPPERGWSDWRVNERNYGALTGRSKADVVREFGEKRFTDWRRSLDSAPDPMSDELHHELSVRPPFDTLPPQALTRTESLNDVIRRVGTFYGDTLVPLLEQGCGVLLVAHGNSLRALCVVLDRLDDDAVRRLNLPTGQPLVYRFDAHLTPEPAGGRYLDEAGAKAGAIALALEGGT